MATGNNGAGCGRARTALCAALIAALLCGLCGCGDESKPESSQPAVTEKTATQTPADSADTEPETLEQELLKRRGKSFDASDYKKIAGAEGIIDIKSEFDCFVDHGYSEGIDCIIVSGGKIYKANFNSLLSNGKNIQEAGTLPEIAAVRYWRFTHDGEIGDMYFCNNTYYKMSCTPFSAEKQDAAAYPLFKRVYRYGADGKTLEDCTQEFSDCDRVYDYGIPMMAFKDGRVSMIFSGQYLDDSASWNWYRDMGWREYIAFDLDLSPIGNEKPLRLFNTNILMTDSAFYEIVYASQPLDDKDKEAQLAPDGSVSPYYPAAAHPNCNLTLRKIELLSAYYADVRNICTSHVITEDYTLLPINEVITQGYNEYVRYSCNTFGHAYREQYGN